MTNKIKKELLPKREWHEQETRSMRGTHPREIYWNVYKKNLVVVKKI